MQFKHTAALIILSTLLSVTAPSAVAGQKLDDATLFAIFDQANAADIWTARLGVKHAHTDEVRKLARMVATDHEKVQQMGRDLARKLGVIPSPPSGDASADNLAKAVAMLQAKSGQDFDRAYLLHEIAYHQSVIDAVKGTLLPSIQNEEFRALVRSVLPGFEHHLAATRAVAAKLRVN